MILTRRHKLRQGDQWHSMGWRFGDDNGWIDVDKEHWGRTVASVDPNKLHTFRRKEKIQTRVKK